MKLAGYVRVSTDEQSKGYGPQMQLEAIKDFCKVNGHELVAVHEDLGLSGATMDRPGLQAMLSQLDQAEGIIVYSVCRLSRDRIDTQIITDRTLWPAGKLLFAATQQVDIRTEEGRLMVALMAGLNQLERVKIIKRTHDGRQAKARAGGYAGGRPSFGKRKLWVLDDQGNVTEKKLIDDPTEAAVMDLIRRHHRSGKTAYAIAKYLNANGYTTKTGKAWTHVQVARIVARTKGGADVSKGTARGL